MLSTKSFRLFAAALGMVLAFALPVLGGEEDALPTVYSLLIGYPESSAAGRGSVLIVPGTQIPSLEGPGELSDKLEEAYQLGSVSLNTRYEKKMVVDRPVAMPATAPGVEVQVTLLGFNPNVATYRVVLKHAGEMLADTPVSVKRGGRAVVGSRDGDAAPYLFVVIGTEGTEPELAEGVTKPKLVKRINPVYPEQARREMIQGTVNLRLIISKDGSVRVLSVEEGPDPLLAEAARAAVSQWLYEPARDEAGNPLEIEFAVTVKFSLE